MRSRLRAILISSFVCAGQAHAAAPVFEPALTLDPVLVNAEIGGSDAVSATDGKGTWVAAWSAHDEIVFSRSSDAGLTFGPAAILNTDFATDFTVIIAGPVEQWDRTPSVAGDSNGQFITVWSRHIPEQGDSIQFARSLNGGATWSAPAMLTDKGGAPSIATDDEGTWIIAWPGKEQARRYTALQVTRSTDGGNTWSPPAELVSNSASGKAVVDARVTWSGGVWVAAWVLQTAGTSIERDLVVSRSTDGGVTWSSPSALNPDGSEFDGLAALASDGAGNWIATWGVRTSYEAQPSDVVMARSGDGAATWSAPVALNPDAGAGLTSNHSQAIAAGAAGEYVVLWTRDLETDDDPDGFDEDIVMISTSDGGATWTSPVPLNDEDVDGGEWGFDHEISPFIAHDPLGHWIAMWSSNDYRFPGVEFGLSVVYALAGHPCGNGLPDPGETCDDGHRGALDCCGRTCGHDVAGTACAADDELCTLERCDGSGVCEHLSAPEGTLCNGDDDVCTFDRCDGASTCRHDLEPRTGCKASLKPRASKLAITDGSDPADRSMKWTWRGEGSLVNEIGRAIGIYDFGVCVFDANGLAARVDVPPGPLCYEDNSVGCWKHSGAYEKYNYQHSSNDGAPNGVKKFSIKGTDRKTTIGLTTQPQNLEVPALPILNLPLRVQLVNELNTCWEGTYSQPTGNSPTSFQASGD